MRIFESLRLHIVNLFHPGYIHLLRLRILGAQRQRLSEDGLRRERSLGSSQDRLDIRDGKCDLASLAWPADLAHDRPTIARWNKVGGILYLDGR